LNAGRNIPGWIARVTALAVLAAGLAGGAGAQYIAFGKNKVNYREFDWQVLCSDHFELYYYPEEEELARAALAAAERSYEHHRAAFVIDTREAIPVILYSSHHDFEQTNITPVIMPEGVTGLTDLLRGRVLMPFDGSFHSFNITLQHELVHAFQLALGERLAQERDRPRPAPIPLWFTEGIADHWSARWDADGDMILRDLVISGKLPELSEFWRYQGTFTMYKLGQSVLEFIEKSYGPDKLLLFYSEAWRRRRFSDLFPIVLGVTEEELSSRWMHWLRERYYPDVLSGDPILHVARQVSRFGAELKPTPVPPGVPGLADHYVFISQRAGYTQIYSASLEGEEEDLRTVIKGQRSARYLSFHGHRSRMDVSNQGWLVFSSQSGERDMLVVHDLVSGQTLHTWGFDDLVGLSSPQWDAEGRRIVFSGLSRSGQCDLFLFDSESGELRRLTDDWFYDIDPQLHPDGRRLVFVSDRGTYGREGARNLFELDLETGDLRALTDGPWWDLAPDWDSAGERLVFASTRDGLRDLYVIDGEGHGGRVTHALEALGDPRWLPSGNEVLATVYHGERMHAAVIPIGAPAARDSIAAPVEPPVAWSWKEEIGGLEARPGQYESRFSIDIAQGGVAVAPGLGTDEGIQLLLRDLMGNRLIFFQLGNATISTSDILDNISGGVSYVDLSRRINRGYSVYYDAGTYYDEFNLPYFERRTGVSLLLSYPFSRFERVETGMGLAYSEKDHPAAGIQRKGMLATHSVSWIHDTALWLPTGPIDGARRHLTLGLTMNLHRPGIENAYALADARHYLRLGTYSALALRAQGRFSEGPDPQVFLLGGPLSLRGYPWGALHGTRAVLGNAEVRIPLLRTFVLVPASVGAIAFPGIQGAVFFDAARAWDEDYSRGWRGSYGFGFRMGLGGMLVLRLDTAWRTTFELWPSHHFTEFFIGWDY
jgi:hypothetical protein